MGYLREELVSHKTKVILVQLVQMNVGGGILDLFSSGYFERQGNLYNVLVLVPDQ